jgi:ABC-type transport system involved in multi-copper enzyme maturation permease subunit
MFNFNAMFNIYSDISRAVRSRGFVFGVLGCLLILAFASIESILEASEKSTPEAGLHIRLILEALESDAFITAFPIICALPFTTAFVDDMKNGFIKQYLSRTSRKRYISGKLIACGFSGGLVLFAGIMLTLIVSSLVFPSAEAVPDGENGLHGVFIKAFAFFFSGMLWSLIGFTLASATMNRYIAYVSPFILYYVLIIVHERYLHTSYILNPNEWIFPSDRWSLGNLGIFLVIAALSTAVCFWFKALAKRRLAD